MQVACGAGALQARRCIRKELGISFVVPLMLSAPEIASRSSRCPAQRPQASRGHASHRRESSKSCFCVCHKNMTYQGNWSTWDSQAGQEPAESGIHLRFDMPLSCVLVVKCDSQLLAESPMTAPALPSFCNPSIAIEFASFHGRRGPPGRLTAFALGSQAV